MRHKKFTNRPQQGSEIISQSCHDKRVRFQKADAALAVEWKAIYY